jgi:hypothetical protein
MIGVERFIMNNNFEKKIHIDDPLIHHLALQSHSPQGKAINDVLNELFDDTDNSNETSKNKPISIRSSTMLMKQNQRVELSHKKSSNIWRLGVFAVSLMLLILGLCGIFSPAKQAMTSAFRSVMSQPQTVTRYETKNIEDIRKDDQVLAYDVRTGQVTKRKVTQVFKRQADHIRYLTIRGENGIQQIVQTTDNHAFWVVTDKPDLERMAREMVTVENVGHEDIELFDENLAVTENGFYVEAKNLRVGDRFLDSSENLLTLIDTRREEFPNGITVYNFTVEDDHNYFVIANYEAFQNGAQPVLVHNSNCDEIKAWIKRDTYNEIRKKFGQRGVNKFVNSMKKGLVGAEGQNGIKLLKGKDITRNGIIYTHEIKIEGGFGNWRVFGYFDPNRKHYIFDWFREGIGKKH